MTPPRPIVCVGFADWDNALWVNQQHLMSRLAARRPVLFVESLGLRRPQLKGRDLRRMARRLRRGLAGPRIGGAAGPEVTDPTGNVHVLSPLVLPLHGNPLVRRLNAKLLPWLVGRAVRALGMVERPVLWAYVPQAESLLESLQPAVVVYHCVDDIGATKGIDAASFAAAERRFAARADLVLASSPKLAERMRALNRASRYAPNVADTKLFATALDRSLPEDGAMAELPRPRIVFTGAVVETKLDLSLIAAVARARPGWSVALVGPVGEGDPGTDVSSLDALPNVHLLGHRAYTTLPAVLRAADAAMIPYARNELTDSIFPMKVYEYLAAGLPVVATPLASLAGVADITLARTPEETVAALEQALADPTDPAERSRRAAEFSWTRRVQQIEDALAEMEERA